MDQVLEGQQRQGWGSGLLHISAAWLTISCQGRSAESLGGESAWPLLIVGCRACSEQEQHQQELEIRPRAQDRDLPPPVPALLEPGLTTASGWPGWPGWPLRGLLLASL